MEQLLVGCNNGLARVSLEDGRSEWVFDGPPVPSVAVDPGNPERVYAATLGKGLWVSNDAGSSFARADGLSADLVWSVTVSASDRRSSLGAVYCGTQMSALFRSTDGGGSFEELESLHDIPSVPEWSFPPAPDTHHVHQIALHPEDPGSVVFGVELGGVYRSRDRGATWTATNADPDPHTLRTHPQDPDRMYEGGGNAFFESRDGGSNWQSFLGGVADELRYFYSLAVDASDPDTLLISAARDPFSGHGIIPGIEAWSTMFRREGDGDWQEVTDGLPPREGTPMGTLVAGGPGVFVYVTEPGEVYRSDDGGRSFQAAGSVELDPPVKKVRSLAVVA